MKIYSWNVNGIRAVEKKGFTDWVLKENPDILCLQETKAEEKQLSDNLRDIPGYSSYFHSAERKGYSGVAIYSKIAPISVSQEIGIMEFDSEGRILIAEYQDFLLFNIYFPNGQKDEVRLDYKLRFYDSVLKQTLSLIEKGKKIIICGDFNTAHREIDLENPKANEKYSGFLPIEREWIDRYLESGFIDTYRYFYPDTVKYSWWSYRFQARLKNIGWRIDYHLVSKNMEDQIQDAFILNEVEGSDHCPVVLQLKD
ncbi:MAG TPA: exodeoxyribonuclease III [Spirochaetia bacterium]|nr:MAG: exodeoxyribonuclease III [Spirochaetes bacterium GWB1_36_13]HCL57052.1 exodeoxyribonuclease III [Spirochaetia bacterium]